MTGCPQCGEELNIPIPDGVDAIALCLHCNTPAVYEYGTLRRLNNKEWMKLFGMTDPISRLLCALKATQN